VSLSAIARAFARSRIFAIRPESCACASSAVASCAMVPTVTIAPSGFAFTVASPVVTMPGGMTALTGSESAGAKVVA